MSDKWKIWISGAEATDEVVFEGLYGPLGA
jgi:hypothetical protein